MIFTVDSCSVGCIVNVAATTFVLPTASATVTTTAIAATVDSATISCPGHRLGWSRWAASVPMLSVLVAPSGNFKGTTVSQPTSACCSCCLPRLSTAAPDSACSSTKSDSDVAAYVAVASSRASSTALSTTTA